MEKYILVEEKDRYSLIGHVITLIEKGWKPQGGVSVYTYGSERFYTQAMIKHEE